MHDMPGRQQGQKLLAQRVKDARWDGRHERSTAHGALAPSRPWPSCLPSPIRRAERRERTYCRPLLVTVRVAQQRLSAGLADDRPPPAALNAGKSGPAVTGSSLALLAGIDTSSR